MPYMHHMGAEKFCWSEHTTLNLFRVMMKKKEKKRKKKQTNKGMHPFFFGELLLLSVHTFPHVVFLYQQLEAVSTFTIYFSMRFSSRRVNEEAQRLVVEPRVAFNHSAGSIPDLLGTSLRYQIYSVAHALRMPADAR